MTTKAQRDDLVQKARKATPGPWEADGSNVLGELKPYFLLWHQKDFVGEVPNSDNAGYIAAASPSVILELCAEREELERERDSEREARLTTPRKTP